MKHFVSILLILLVSPLSSQSTIDGKIIDASSNENLAYVNIGIVGKNILSREDIEQSVNDQTYGVIVSNLIINGPAHKAGFRIGDLIVSMNGKKVHDLNMLQRLLSIKHPGEKNRFEIYRLQTGFMFLNLKLQEIPKTSDLPEDVDIF